MCLLVFCRIFMITEKRLVFIKNFGYNMGIKHDEEDK